MGNWGGKYLNQTVFRAALGALLLAVVLCAGASAQVADNGPPLEGDAYTAAETAYKAFGQGDYKASATSAAEAVALRPDLLRLHLLLIDLLVAAGDLTQAEQATKTASAAFAGNQELEGRQANIRQRLAQRPAGEGYKALEKGDAKAAIRAARSAVEYAPDSMSYRLLLLSAQIADSNFNDAVATATGAIKLDPGNYVPLVWRAYLYQKLGNRAQAVSDFNAALATPNLTDIEKKNIRLIAADAALASGDFRAAQELLAEFSKTDPAVVTRLGDADAVAEKKATLKGDGKLMPLPAQTCRDTPYGSVCSLEAPLVQSIAIPVASRRQGGRREFSKPQARPTRPAGRRITPWPSKRRRKAVEAQPGRRCQSSAAGEPDDQRRPAGRRGSGRQQGHCAGPRHRRNLRPARLCP